MGRITKREVKEHSPQFKRAVLLSIILSIFSVVFVLNIPNIRGGIEHIQINRDVKSVERVYNTLQDIIAENTVTNIPSALWNISLEDIETMYSLETLRDEMRKQLKVSDLRKLEKNGFKSKAYKGSIYEINMIEESGELHLIVRSNDSAHDDIEY